MPAKERTPNDERAIVKNPNNPAYEADQANRTRQAEEARRPAPVGERAKK